MKTAILIVSAILFWQTIHAAPFYTGSGSNKVLSSKVSQSVEYNETAIDEMLEDPRCSPDRLWDTAKCECFLTWMEGTLTTNGNLLCKEAFGKDPSELNACSIFTNNGVLNKEEARKDAQNVTEECLNVYFGEDSSSTAAERMDPMRHECVRIRTPSCIRNILRLLREGMRRWRPTPRPPTTPPLTEPTEPTTQTMPSTMTTPTTQTTTQTTEPSPSDTSRMLTQEFARTFNPKTAKLLSYNSWSRTICRHWFCLRRTRRFEKRWNWVQK